MFQFYFARQDVQRGGVICFKQGESFSPDYLYTGRVFANRLLGAKHAGNGKQPDREAKAAKSLKVSHGWSRGGLSFLQGRSKGCSYLSFQIPTPEHNV